MDRNNHSHRCDGIRRLMRTHCEIPPSVSGTPFPGAAAWGEVQLISRDSELHTNFRVAECLDRHAPKAASRLNTASHLRTEMSARRHDKCIVPAVQRRLYTPTVRVRRYDVHKRFATSDVRPRVSLPRRTMLERRSSLHVLEGQAKTRCLGLASSALAAYDSRYAVESQ